MAVSDDAKAADAAVIDEEVPRDQPMEIEDEFQLALEEADVFDESLLEQPNDIKFTINSYGADYTVDTLVKRLKTEAFYVPQFQRKFVWSQRHASRFLESLLMGLPVPGIFLYKEPVTNRHLVVDGQQRLRTLQYFYTGTFLEKKFRLVGVHQEWNGRTYEELSAADKLKLDDSTVHATIFQQEEPKNSRKSLNLVFDRVNSGGIRLSPQEIRNCVSDGPLLNCIRDMNDDETWRFVFGKHRNSRLKDQELILRFLAMHERGERYTRPMRDFLDDFADDLKAAPDPTLEQFRSLFARTIKMCWDAKGRDAFRPVRSLNAAVFEGVMIGVAARLEEDAKPPEPKEIARRYDMLLGDKIFMRACERATAVDESVRVRRTHAIQAFACEL